MSYAEKAALMDAEVDDRLGDSIFYSFTGAHYVELKGFVIEVDQGDEYGGVALDPQVRRRRVKLSVAKLGGRKPQQSDRIKAEMLGEGVYRPSVGKVATAGRYWLFDVVKV